MVYVQIKAGLGNQLFQYAFGRAVSIEQKKPLVLDTSWYSNHIQKDTPRAFLLDKFNINARVATDEELKKFYTSFKKLYRKIYRRLIYKKDYLFHPKELRVTSSFFEGHWANEKYFKKYASIIREEIVPKKISPASETILSEISSNKTNDLIPVSVHVRRGDCVTNPHAASYQGTIDTSFYEAAYTHLSSKYKKDSFLFYIFSDDIDWAKANILKETQRIFVSRPEITDYEELYIMSKCEHHIIANSSFSWWGAWLNPSQTKIVIAPNKWLKDTSFDTSDACPAEWVRL